MADDRLRTISRRLRDAIEPIAANVYFAGEAIDRYAELGLGYVPGYFCSRGACLGQVPGEVVAAAFGVFNPDVVIPAVTEGWAKVDATTILGARQEGATASLTRLLVEETPDGTAPASDKDVARATELLRRAGAAPGVQAHPLFAGLRSLGWPGDAMGDLWRAADLVREHRGDSHNAAWVAAGVGPVEITLLTELWWRMPLNSYVRTRGWTAEQISAAIEGLRDRKLLDGDQLTPEGRELRAAVESATDLGEAAVVEALSGDAEELCELVEPWARTIVAAKGYPADPSALTRR
jgi:hypothetical protein